MKSPSRRPNWLVAALALGAAVALLLAPVPDGLLGPWQGMLLDLGHVPLFAALLVALRVTIGPPLVRPLIVAIVLAGLAEVVQPLVGRTGAWLDFGRGVLGALAAAAVVRAWEPGRPRPARAAYGGVAVALLVWPAVEAAPYLADTTRGIRLFPVLADFRTDHELRRWECDQATIVRVGGGRPGARLALHPGPSPYSGAALRPVVSDFRGYRWLCWDFRVVSAPVDLVASVRSRADGETGTTHAQLGRGYPVGRHVLRLNLADLAERARPVPLDFSGIRYVQLFVVRTPEVVTIDLYRVWLEP